ncbi:conserved hypothetical protein [Ricinus communis]|uniref:Uncharacterized protein n=1 Tax=Ricinus communis TaxID=3988 RepID=B9RMW2_RICCO|nr:conserved hypothetical protein [Ricinus communis]
MKMEIPIHPYQKMDVSTEISHSAALHLNTNGGAECLKTIPRAKLLFADET